MVYNVENKFFPPLVPYSPPSHRGAGERTNSKVGTFNFLDRSNQAIFLCELNINPLEVRALLRRRDIGTQPNPGSQS